MKKLLTLILALLLLLGLCAPAMAFTSDSEADDDSVPYELKIYLVEYDDNDFFGIASLPESDRGYAKNEIVAAVVELYVPEDETVGFPDNSSLKFGGENVDLNVADNYSGGVIRLTTTSNVVEIPAVGGNVSTIPVLDDDEIMIALGFLDGEDTYKWLFFAKVTGDDASLYAELKDGMFPDFEFPEQGPAFPLTTLDGIVYGISKSAIPDGYRYTIEVGTGDYTGNFIWIDVDEDYVSQGMTLFTGGSNPGNNPGILGVDTNGKLGVADIANPAVLKTSGDLYDDVMDFYNDVVVDVFGMDYMLIGNYVRDSYFEDLVSPKTLIATVDIEPWTAYVTVPDNIVVDPPKTGDAASIMGFVMAALSSGAGVVALRKRG